MIKFMPVTLRNTRNLMARMDSVMWHKLATGFIKLCASRSDWKVAQLVKSTNESLPEKKAGRDACKSTAGRGGIRDTASERA